MVSEMIHRYVTVLSDDMLGVLNEKIGSFFIIANHTETEYNHRVTEICVNIYA
jgi:hypothetical protein